MQRPLALLLLAASPLAQAALQPAPDAVLRAVPESGNPLAITDEGLFPFPSRFFQAADETASTGVRTAYPSDVLQTPEGAVQVDFSVFNFADGHPPAAPLLVHFGADVAAEFLVNRDATPRSIEENAPIALFDLERGTRVPLLIEMDQNFRDAEHAGRHVLILRPVAPMRMGARHVAVLTRDLRTPEGDELPLSPGFRALRDGTPTDRAELEQARADYEQLFEFLGEQGYAREELLLAWDFAVASEQSVLGPILSMREQALGLAGGTGLGYEIESVTRDPNEDVALLVEGRFEVPCFLDADEKLERLPDGRIQLQEETRWYPFTMLVPPQARAGEPLPLVVFGHGIFGTGNRYLAGGIGRELIQPLSHQFGAVVIATDWIGLSGNDRDIVGRIVRDLNKVHMVTDRLQQALVNNLVLTELALGNLADDELFAFAGEDWVDPSRVYYYGVSLGGIQGISLVSLSPRISRAMLAVPGGCWSALLSRSIVFKPFKILIDSMYPDPLLQQAYIAMLQAKFDGSDGVNVGQLLVRRPLPDAPAERRVVLLEAIGDCQVPNLTTHIVARSIGLAQLRPVVEPVWGLERVEGPTTRPVLAQILQPDALARYTPPELNVLPEKENGTHSDIVRLDPAILQLMRLLETGMVEQFCEGACDPD